MRLGEQYQKFHPENVRTEDSSFVSKTPNILKIKETFLHVDISQVLLPDTVFHIRQNKHFVFKSLVCILVFVSVFFCDLNLTFLVWSISHVFLSTFISKKDHILCYGEMTHVLRSIPDCRSNNGKLSPLFACLVTHTRCLDKKDSEKHFIQAFKTSYLSPASNVFQIFTS